MLWPLPSKLGDEIYLDMAQRHLDTSQRYGLSVTDPVAMNRRLLQEYLPLFTRRAASGRPNLALRDMTREGVGGLMELYLAVSDECEYREFSGRLSELVAHYGLLAGSHTIFPTSPRQESNLFTGDNHDIDAFDPRRGVIPVSVKHIGPEDDNPLVAMLRVGVLAKEAWEETLETYGTGSERADCSPVAATCTLARIMTRHAKGADARRGRDQVPAMLYL